MKKIYSICLLFDILLALASCTSNDDAKQVPISESWLSGTWYASEEQGDIHHISVTFKGRETVYTGAHKDIPMYWYEGEINYAKGSSNVTTGQLTYGSILYFVSVTPKAESFESILLSRDNGSDWTMDVVATGVSESGDVVSVKAEKRGEEGGSETYNLTLYRSQVDAWNR